MHFVIWKTLESRVFVRATELVRLVIEGCVRRVERHQQKEWLLFYGVEKLESTIGYEICFITVEFALLAVGDEFRIAIRASTARHGMPPGEPALCLFVVAHMPFAAHAQRVA